MSPTVEARLRDFQVASGALPFGRGGLKMTFSADVQRKKSWAVISIAGAQTKPFMYTWGLWHVESDENE